jgi:chemotaxis response regulator CheB
MLNNLPIIATEPDTTEQPDMPESAIASGYIDFVLVPEDIAQEIVLIARAVVGKKKVAALS